MPPTGFLRSSISNLSPWLGEKHTEVQSGCKLVHTGTTAPATHRQRAPHHPSKVAFRSGLRGVSPLRGLFVLSSLELALLSESQSLAAKVLHSLCFLPERFQAGLVQVIGLR